MYYRNNTDPIKMKKGKRKELLVQNQIISSKKNLMCNLIYFFKLFFFDKISRIKIVIKIIFYLFLNYVMITRDCFIVVVLQDDVEKLRGK